MLKPLLLTTAGLLFYSAAATAQCTPNPLYADSTFGVWPDTTTNLPCAFGDQSAGYNAVIDIKTLTDTAVSLTISGLPLNLTAYIEKFRINTVEGLPTGFTFIPNTNEWTNGGAAPNFTSVQGCVSILANQASVQAILAANPGGIDIPLTVFVDAKIHSTDNQLANTIIAGNWLSDLSSIPGITAIPVSGYQLRVRQNQADGCGEVSIANAPEWSAGMQIAPNPVSEQANLVFLLSQPKALEFRVFNAQGQLVSIQQIQGSVGENRVNMNCNDLPSGLYVYTLSDGVQSASKTFVISAE